MSEYGNISKVRVTSDKIWTPDLLLYNSAELFDTTSKVNAIIESNGNVCYLPPGVFKATCSIDVDNFPFDEQICTVKFGSWTYDESQVNATNKSERGQMDSYIPNNEWFLMGLLFTLFRSSYVLLFFHKSNKFIYLLFCPTFKTYFATRSRSSTTVVPRNILTLCSRSR